MSKRLPHSLREAALALLAMLGALACTQALAPGAASGMLGAVLALALLRQVPERGSALS